MQLAASDDVVVISPTSIRSGLFPLYTTPLHKTSSYNTSPRNTSPRNTSSRNTCPACNIVEASLVLVITLVLDIVTLIFPIPISNARTERAGSRAAISRSNAVVYPVSPDGTAEPWTTSHSHLPHQRCCHQWNVRRTAEACQGCLHPSAGRRPSCG
ncbi:hypothetical protein CC77DRAFT_558639 [Alternaria alternata]|uniref:Uncharacterized protein n=1 Tax=Alternaria alternata TaxID=5599 RepID=A0A177D4U3_ALTAL|nr:hypothetical protein CC77DRAFT_558639 [Alternaria alternata]OAG14518.1 hypothetical protein CC77DRAFT_558639 [Alternaria alternata]